MIYLLRASTVHRKSHVHLRGVELVPRKTSFSIQWVSMGDKNFLNITLVQKHTSHHILIHTSLPSSRLENPPQITIILHLPNQPLRLLPSLHLPPILPPQKEPQRTRIHQIQHQIPQRKPMT
jgi:hypothetical protein